MVPPFTCGRYLPINRFNGVPAPLSMTDPSCGVEVEARCGNLYVMEICDKPVVDPSCCEVEAFFTLYNCCIQTGAGTLYSPIRVSFPVA